jgi:hypothetical protein
MCVYATYDNTTRKPKAVGIQFNGNTSIIPLWQPGAGKKLYVIFKNIEKIRQTIVKAAENNIQIVTTDFKDLLRAFKLPLDMDYNVYDLHLPALKAPDITEFNRISQQVLDAMASRQVQSYQKLIADAAVAYQRLEDCGLYLNYTHVQPEWSMKTFAGRSKSLGFNIQGYYEPDMIRPPRMDDRCVLIHFDWVCADIRAASLLSGDKALEDAFIDSDPYDYILNIINDGLTDAVLDRDEAKLLMLKSINSMDVDNVVLSDIYQDLGKWITKAKAKIETNGSLETLLGRKFRIKDAKNSLAVLNGAMQGSVAHGMHNVMAKINRVLPYNMIGDIHDSIVMASCRENADILSLIKCVIPIMSRPFAGLLESNPIFPVKVSIGERWKQWKLFKTFR